MAKQIINLGTTANDGSGDPLRTAFTKINTNFTELYTLTGGTAADLKELSQDYAAPMFTHASHVNITATYDDANNKIVLTGVASAVWPVTNTAGANGPTRIAIGNSAGDIAQGNATVAVGSYAGNDTQGGAAVAIGTYAGTTTQRNDAIAIGYLTGNDVQGIGAVSIGRQAGQTNQGTYSIAIGKLAGQTNQAANTIILNALNAPLNGVSAQTNSFYVNPIRTDATPGNILFYNTTTKEITYGAAGSVSSLVNGANTASLGSDGVLTVPHSIFGNGTSLALSTGATAPGAAVAINTSEVNINFSDARGGFKFKNLGGATGSITFPDDTVQSTAYVAPTTGNSIIDSIHPLTISRNGMTIRVTSTGMIQMSFNSVISITGRSSINNADSVVISSPNGATTSGTWYNIGAVLAAGDHLTATIVDSSFHRIYRLTSIIREKGTTPGSEFATAYAIIEQLQ